MMDQVAYIPLRARRGQVPLMVGDFGNELAEPEAGSAVEFLQVAQLRSSPRAPTRTVTVAPDGERVNAPDETRPRARACPGPLGGHDRGGDQARLPTSSRSDELPSLDGELILASLNYLVNGC